MWSALLRFLINCIYLFWLPVFAVASIIGLISILRMESQLLMLRRLKLKIFTPFYCTFLVTVFMIYAYVHIDFVFSSSYSFIAIDMLWVVFDEHVRRGKSGGGNSREMDFESFLDFVLALENKDTPEGLTYLFRCLDLQGRGYLTTADIHSLFRWTSSSALNFHNGLESHFSDLSCLLFLVAENNLYISFFLPPSEQPS